LASSEGESAHRAHMALTAALRTCGRGVAWRGGSGRGGSPGQRRDGRRSAAQLPVPEPMPELVLRCARLGWAGLGWAGPGSQWSVAAAAPRTTPAVAQPAQQTCCHPASPAGAAAGSGVLASRAWQAGRQAAPARPPPPAAHLVVEVHQPRRGGLHYLAAHLAVWGGPGQLGAGRHHRLPYVGSEVVRAEQQLVENVGVVLRRFCAIVCVCLGGRGRGRRQHVRELGSHRGPPRSRS
jgi:hypothetical protein